MIFVVFHILIVEVMRNLLMRESTVGSKLARLINMIKSAGVYFGIVRIGTIFFGACS